MPRLNKNLTIHEVRQQSLLRTQKYRQEAKDRKNKIRALETTRPLTKEEKGILKNREMDFQITGIELGAARQEIVAPVPAPVTGAAQEPKAAELTPEQKIKKIHAEVIKQVLAERAEQGLDNTQVADLYKRLVTKEPVMREHFEKNKKGFFYYTDKKSFQTVIKRHVASQRN